ncbi:hypothetical protein EYF80_047157 [Liparis tanakae]|uniref:Uncharacterized protein n=1 Tax=Liparis tanakae TaxID=230148 RepID=A0A4Z2FP73_9TELE|nr:hypothetical protein EYF80_047157 [Liparis tanakae]
MAPRFQVKVRMRCRIACFTPPPRGAAPDSALAVRTIHVRTAEPQSAALVIVRSPLELREPETAIGYFARGEEIRPELTLENDTERLSRTEEDRRLQLCTFLVLAVFHALQKFSLKKNKEQKE